MKLTLSFILDFFFFVATTFLIFLIWIRFFINNLFLVLLLSIILTIIISFFLLFIKFKKDTKKNITKKHQQEFLNFKKLILTSSRSQISEILENIFNIKKNCSNLFNFLGSFYFERKNNYFLGHNKTLFTHSCNSLIINDTDVKNILNKNCLKFNNIYILCNEYSDLAKEITTFYIKNNIKLITLSEFYKSIVKDLNLFISPNAKEIKKSKKIKGYFSQFFSEKQTKHFLLCGFSMFIGSFIVRYNIYYIIFSTILFIFAIVCRIRNTRALY